MNAVLRIATRQSPLALWQARHVQARLAAAGLRVELVPMTTSGDRQLGGPLAASGGGKGLFTKELEEALLDGRADLAVHSMKDVPVRRAPGLVLDAVLEGEDPRDAFVSARHRGVEALPPGARVGTASLRRQAQLLAHRPDLAIEPLRGNVGTRLAKLDEGRFDAILLACAGLTRLGQAERITQALPVDRFVPAIGQGVIGLECREDDAATRTQLARLNDARSAARIGAERALNAKLGGACTVPVAGHAIVQGERLSLTGLVAAPDGTRIVRAAIDGRAADGPALGEALAARLLEGGGREILRALGVPV